MTDDETALLNAQIDEMIYGQSVVIKDENGLRHVPVGSPEYEKLFKLKDDIQPENVWYFCTRCGEEYHLPEDTEKCPICSSDKIETV